MKRVGFTHESTYNESKEWYTPKAIFDALGLTFDLDPASPGAEVVPWIPATEHYTIMDNGLALPWHGRVWLNPSYGSDTPAWVSRFAEWDDGVMLVFARTDTAWFHHAAESIRGMLFIRGRVRFISAKTGTPDGGGAGAGSLLLAQGQDCNSALHMCGLGLHVDLGIQRVSW